MIFLFLSYILTLTCLFSIGYAILYALKVSSGNELFDSFSSLLLGMFFSVTIYALYATVGRTVLVFCIPLSLYIYHLANKASLRPKISKVNLLPLFTGVLTVFLFQHIITGGTFFVPDIDTFVYADHARTLSYLGIENNASYVTNLINPDLSVTPYHYLELWLSAMVMKVYGFNALETYQFITIPIYLSISYFGLMAILNHVGFKGWKLTIYSLGAMFIGGLYIAVYSFIPWLEPSKYVANNMFTDNIISYPLVIAGCYYFIREQYEKAFLLLLFLPIISFSTLPAVGGGVVIWAMLNANGNKGNKLRIAATSIALTAILPIYYIYWGDQSTSRLQINDLIFLYLPTLESGQLQYLFKKIAVFTTLYPVKLVAVYIIPVALLCRKKRIIIQYKWWFIIPLVGLIASFLFSPNHEATWLFRNIGIPMINILLVYLFAQQIAKNEWSKTNVIILIFVLASIVSTWVELSNRFSSSQPYSKEYLTKVSMKFVDEENVLGALFLEPGYFENSFAKNPKSVLPTHFLLNFPQYAGVVNFNSASIPISARDDYKRIDQRFIDASDFEVFKRINDYETSSKAMLAFIDQYELKFVVASENVVIPVELRDRLGEEIVDSNTGQRFIMLRY